MAETPFMSAYLSAANRVAKTVVGRGKWPGLIEFWRCLDCRSVSAHPTTCSDATGCSHRPAHVFEKGSHLERPECAKQFDHSHP